MYTRYNVSRYESQLSEEEWSFYNTLSQAEDEAEEEAKNSGVTYYVHEVTFRPVVKADVTMTVTKVVM